MATTRAAGQDGAITSPSGTHDAALQRWSLSFMPVVANVSAFADVVGRSRQGVVNVSGSASGVPTYGSNNTAPFGAGGSAAQIDDGDFPNAGATWVFQQATGCTITAVMLAGVELSSDHESNSAAVSYTLNHGDSSTSPSLVWAET